MREAVREPNSTCPVCGGGLKLRLGQLECAACGFTPPEEQRQEDAQVQRRPYPSPADARLRFFAPVHYLPSEPAVAGESLYLSKRLCYRCYAWMLMLPVIGFIGLMFWITSMMAGDNSGGGISSTLGAIWIAAALCIVVWGFNIAIELAVLRWVLLGEVLWSKWGCMYVIGFRVLLNGFQCLVFMLTGQIGNQPGEPAPMSLRWILLAIYTIWLLQHLWIGFILFCETTQRKSY